MRAKAWSALRNRGNFSGAGGQAWNALAGMEDEGGGARMNLERIEEYADGSEFDRAFLSEVAKRVDALWGGLRIEAAAGAAVGTLFHTTLIFRDGFKVNHSSDLNTFLGVNGAAAVIAAVWDWMGLGWLEMLARYRPTRGCSAPPAALYMELHALALRHPSIVLVDDDPARWPRWQAPEEPPATESKAARRRRRRRLALPGGSGDCSLRRIQAPCSLRTREHSRNWSWVSGFTWSRWRNGSSG